MEIVEEELLLEPEEAARKLEATAQASPVFAGVTPNPDPWEGGVAMLLPRPPVPLSPDLPRAKLSPRCQWEVVAESGTLHEAVTLSPTLVPTPTPTKPDSESKSPKLNHDACIRAMT